MNKDTSYLLASSFFISMAVSQLEQIQKSRDQMWSWQWWQIKTHWQGCADKEIEIPTCLEIMVLRHSECMIMKHLVQKSNIKIYKCISKLGKIPYKNI